MTTTTMKCDSSRRFFPRDDDRSKRDDRSSLIEEESGSRGIPGHWRRLARTRGAISRLAGDSRDSLREGSFLGRLMSTRGKGSSRDLGSDKADRSSEIETSEPVVLLSLQRAQEDSARKVSAAKTMRTALMA